MKQNTEASNGQLAERLAVRNASGVSEVAAAGAQQTDSDAAQILLRLSRIQAEGSAHGIHRTPGKTRLAIFQEIKSIH